MPPPDSILAGLTHIANSAFWVAVVWHGLLAASLAGLALGWRPRERVATAAMAALAASVAVLAFLFGNPFNGVVFSLLTAGALAVARTRPASRVRPGPAADVAAGAVLLLYAWVYPHFLQGLPPVAYAIGSPLGLLPCPTLSAIVGLTVLQANRFGQGWTAGLAGAGLLYGLIGVFRLGVWLDVGLLAGTAWLVVRTLPGWLHVAGPRHA